jgi:ATP-dependent exoDNAse (exonuclease V) beta subunit
MDKAFVKDFDPRTIELNENYRSSIAVLQALYV